MGLESDKRRMEFAASSKPLKPSSNISDVVSKFAKVYKLRSIGVFNTSENPDPDQIFQIISRKSGPLLDQEIGNATEDAKKIHLQPTEVQKNENVCGHVEILKLFDTVLALKLAYVKLQEAHIPYDPEKIRTADEEVVSRLDSLCKIKKAYKEKLMKEANSVSACSALLLAEIQVKEKALEKLKSQAKNKEIEVANLRQELEELGLGNKKLAEQIMELERGRFFKGLKDHNSFENVVELVGKAIHDFAKPLIALMKLSSWDLDQAANAIQESVEYTKRSHKKYAFEAYVGRRMFHEFSPQQPCSILEKLMKLDDPIVALMENPQSSFAKFCRKKYLLVVHPKMEKSFFSNLDHRNFVANGIHPYTPFYRAFVRMARWVWYLLGFSAVIGPKVEIFGVKQGSEFSGEYMEVIEELKEYKGLLDKGQERCKVEFMVMPGFKVGENIIRSQVYISKGEFSNGMYYEEGF